MRKTFGGRVAVLMLVSGMASSGLASTSAPYTTDCKYIDGQRKVCFNGRCEATFGIAGVDGRGVRYILTFPGDKEVEIWLYNHHDLASVNGVPAKVLARKARLAIVTGENERYEFGHPPPDAL